jgi:hypothetical protein
MPLASLTPFQSGEHEYDKQDRAKYKKFGAKLTHGASGSFIVQLLSALAYTR